MRASFSHIYCTCYGHNWSNCIEFSVALIYHFKFFRNTKENGSTMSYTDCAMLRNVEIPKDLSQKKSNILFSFSSVVFIMHKTQGTSVIACKNRTVCASLSFVQRQTWIVDEDTKQRRGGIKGWESRKEICSFVLQVLFVSLWFYVMLGLCSPRWNFLPLWVTVVSVIASKQRSDMQICDTILTQGMGITLIHVQTSDTSIHRRVHACLT